MAGRHPKGTNDADGDGKKGGSLPKKLSNAERIDAIVQVLKANGLSLPEGLE